MPVCMEKVLIIGTGCAGLTAGIYTARANLAPLLLTGTMPGGLLTTTSVVENYPGFPEGIDGYELMVRMQKQAERFGARVQFGMVEGIDVSRRPLVVKVDGIARTAAAGETIRLRPGQSICIPPRTIHQFWGEEGAGLTVSSEVSSVCDDWNDNVFLVPNGVRFPKVLEDEPRTHCLCHEYPRAGQ